MATPVFAPAPAHHHAAPAATSGVDHEARRRFAVRLVLFIYVLSLLEGPLRKWFLPGLATPIYFLRDPFVVLLYVYCLQHRLFAWGGLGRLWLGFAVAASLVALLPFAFYGIDVRAWVLGVRSYWVYLPLAFAIAGTFRREDVERFLRWNVLLAVPYAFLIATQYGAGRDAWVNRGIAGDSESAVGLGEEILRPFGLFTYTGPNVGFTAAMIAFFLAWYLMGARVRWRPVILAAGAVAVGTMAVLTGSRSIYFLAGAILATTLVGSTLANPTPRTIGRNLGIALFVALAAGLFVTVYSDMLAAMEVRFERAAANEGSIWRRALAGPIAFVEPLSTAPLFGYGIGTGTPAIARFVGNPALIYGEGELQRVVNELGVALGLAFVLLRYGTAATLGLRALATARRGELAILPLAGYTAVPIAMGQITHSPINGFMPWLAVGLVLALASTLASDAGPQPVRKTVFTPGSTARDARSERP
ncbi:MAG: hypothetical protein ACLFU0_09595 [Alphaproteobacteria bacterium]